MHKSQFNKRAKLNVLRLDSIIIDKRPDPKKRNIRIIESIKQSNALIYQSNFCKEVHNRVLGIKDNKKFRIIFNGADPNEFLPRNPKNYFLANCKWRPPKRLKDVIKSFIVSSDLGLDSDLIITGRPKVEHRIKHPRIKYLEWQNKEQIKKLLSGAIASLHLTWLDWCPNSMVESLVAGCPVIYAKSGGLIELGKNSGIGIGDKMWDFNFVDSFNPPKIDKQSVALAMLKMKKENIKIEKRKDLYISNVCDQYIGFFKELLER